MNRVRPEAAPEELAAALDDGQEVVEVVGDAAGELPDRLHLLRLTNLSLELLPLADVSERDDRPDQLPVFGADRRAGVLDREARAIPPPKDFVLPPLHLALAKCGVDGTLRLRVGRAVAPRVVEQRVHRPADEFLGWPSEQGGGRRVDERGEALRILAENSLARRRQDQLVLMAEPLQRLLRLPALRDVEKCSEDGGPSVPGDDRHQYFDPDRRAVLRHPLGLVARRGPFAPQPRGSKGLDARALLRRDQDQIVSADEVFRAPVAKDPCHRFVGELNEAILVDVHALEGSLDEHAIPLLARLEGGGGGLRLCASGLLVREEARIPECERRLVGKCLRESNLLVGEEPSFPISDAQGANHPVPREERHGEHGAVGRVRQTVPDLWGEGYPRIDEDIRRRERPALTDRQSGQARAPRQLRDPAGHGSHAGGEGDRDEVP